MAYKYFCTECGQENSAQTVLFDMEALLTQSGKQTLNIIKLRMDQKELEALIDSGKPGADDYSDCVLRFDQLADYLASERSMNDPRIKELTLSDIEEYLFQEDEKKEEEAAAVQSAAEADDILGDDFGEEELDDIFGEPARKPEPEKKKEIDYSKMPQSVQALLAASVSNTGAEADEALLKSDLQTVYRLFQTEEDCAYHFRMKRHLSRDDKKEQYIDGYWLDGSAIDNARICRRCRKMLFAKAGAAEHRVVSFIGETAAGKTSTILSLTHYALHGLNGIGDGNAELLWQNDPNIPEQKLFTNVVPEALKGRPNELESDLNWFTFGVAPRKTEAGKREDAYHSTLLLQDKDGKRMIVSLMDLPGELFNNGKVDENKVTSEFTAALSSSAFIICFDARTVTIEDITNLTNFSNQMQDLRLTRAKEENHYVPSMILFTMADDTSLPEDASSDTASLAADAASLTAGTASVNPAAADAASLTAGAASVNPAAADAASLIIGTGSATADAAPLPTDGASITAGTASAAADSTSQPAGKNAAGPAADGEESKKVSSVDAANPEEAVLRAALLRMEKEKCKPSDLYMLRRERDAMADERCKINRIYQVVRSIYDKNPMLRDSYYAVMRCGAFGHMVPTTRDITARSAAVNEDNHIADVDAYNALVEECNQNAYTDEELAAANKRIMEDDEYDKLILVYDYNLRTTEYNRSVDAYNRTVTRNNEKQIKRVKASAPKPNQMDLLMQWILHVTGSLPCDTVYETKAAKRSLEKYYIGDLEYRAVNPGSKSAGADADLDEAMAREMLFINPGCWDDALLKALNNAEETTGFTRLVQKMLGSRVEGSLENIRSRMKKAPESNSSDL